MRGLHKAHFERGIGLNANTICAPVISESSCTQQNELTENPWIMIIDDSATIRKIVETCLGREGYQVIGFSDGVTALRWLAEPDAHIPALVIVDINLPRMNGYQVAQYLNTKYQQIAIIMLSRRNGAFDKLKARLVGAKEYLVKPFQTKNLLDVVTMYAPFRK